MTTVSETDWAFFDRFLTGLPVNRRDLIIWLEKSLPVLSSYGLCGGLLGILGVLTELFGGVQARIARGCRVGMG